MIVGATAAVSFSSVVFFNPVLGVFVAPLSAEFGWSRAQLSLGVTIGSGAAALASPGIGWAMDRWGGRWVMAPAAALMGPCLLALGSMTALWQFYLFYALGRGLAQGAINLSAGVAVANWFARRRSLAMAMVALGQRLGMASLPLLAALVIAAGGWRVGYVALAAVALGVGVAPPLLLLRRRPEDVGLRPDGDAAVHDSGDGLLPSTAADWSLRDALRTRSYWLVGFGIAVLFFSAGSINLHLIPHLQDRGLASTQAALVVAVFSVAGGAGGLLGGAVATRLSGRWTLAASLAGQSAGVLLLIGVNGLTGAIVFAASYGLVFGSSVTLNQVIYADYFGRRSLGLISGSFRPVQLTFNAVGPFLTGLWFDRAGSYDAAFGLFSALFLLAAAFVALSPYPRRAG